MKAFSSTQVADVGIRPFRRTAAIARARRLFERAIAAGPRTKTGRAFAAKLRQEMCLHHLTLNDLGP